MIVSREDVERVREAVRSRPDIAGFAMGACDASIRLMQVILREDNPAIGIPCWCQSDTMLPPGQHEKRCNEIRMIIKDVSDRMQFPLTNHS